MPRRRWPYGWMAAVAVIVVASGALVLLLTKHHSRVSGYSPRPYCASNEHQIGLAILLYRHNYSGHYPPTLADLLAKEQIGPGVFICPSSTDTPAVLSTMPPTTQQAAAAFAVPGHLSYVYCGHADWTDPTVPADTVVLYEPPANHGSGANVLFGDGHADWVPQPRLGRLIAAAAATSRPVSAAAVP